MDFYLPETAREQLKWEQAGLMRPIDGGPDNEAAGELERRLQRHMGTDQIIVRLATRGSNEGNWGIYYQDPQGNVSLCVPIATEDGAYKYPAPEIVSQIRDTHADAQHYQKLMDDEFNRQKKNRDTAAREWGQRGKEVKDWIEARYCNRENFAHRKGIKLHKDKVPA